MEVKDLRIGNYVFDRGNPTDLKPSQLVNIIEGRYVIYQSITLTVEWLLKFGFKQIDKYTFVKGKHFIYHRKRGFVTGSTKREVKLNFVHILQNWWYFNNNLEELIKEE